MAKGRLCLCLSPCSDTVVVTDRQTDRTKQSHGWRSVFVSTHTLRVVCLWREGSLIWWPPPPLTDIIGTGCVLIVQKEGEERRGERPCCPNTDRDRQKHTLCRLAADTSSVPNFCCTKGARQAWELADDSGEVISLKERKKESELCLDWRAACNPSLSFSLFLSPVWNLLMKAFDQLWLLPLPPVLC